MSQVPSDRVRCLVCNGAYKALNGGHLGTHGLTAAEYRALHPGAQTFSEATRATLAGRSRDLVTRPDGPSNPQRQIVTVSAEAYAHSRSPDRVVCLVCCNEFKALSHTHLRLHGLTAADYKARYPGAPLVSETTRETWAAHGRDRLLDRRGHSTRDGLVLETWTEAQIIAALKNYVRRHGIVPSIPDWSRRTSTWAGDDLAVMAWRPSYSTIRRVFGSWTAGLAAAGLQPRSPGWRKTQQRKCKRGHLLADALIDPNGGRRCRTCDKMRQQAKRDRQGRPGVARGSRVGGAKLTERQVVEIRLRHAAGEAAVCIGMEMRVSKWTIFDIVARKTWTHV